MPRHDRNQSSKKWAEKCRKKYGGRFDYTAAILAYQTQKGPVVPIFCKLHHHKFVALPDHHVQRMYGCCVFCERDGLRAYFLKREKKKFLKWFEENRAERLDIVGQFTAMTEPLAFKCRLHQTTEFFLPTLIMHTSHRGCTRCARESLGRSSRIDADDLKVELQKDLPEGKKIKSVIFDEERRTTRIVVECEIHGVQEPIAIKTFKNSPFKCRTCGRESVGYGEHRLKNLIESGSQGRPCSVAVMEIEAHEIKALKVGITTRSLEERYREALITVFYEVNLPEREAIVLENRIKIAFANQKDERIIKKGMREKERWAGDTELYWFKCKEPIIDYIKRFIEDLKNEQIDYESEVGKILIPTPFPRSSKFEMGEFQGPIPVIGIDAKTNEVLYECASGAEAERLGFDNIGLIVSEKYSRSTSGGVRWFKKSEFDPLNIPPLEIPHATPVYCVERNQHFRSTMEAEEKMRALGFKVTGSKISAVLNGHRPKAAGFSWQRSSLTTAEIIGQDQSNFIDFRPVKNSNEKKKVKLTRFDDPEEKTIYPSVSQAARAISSSPGNLHRARRVGGIVKGYLVEYIEEN